jgi:hypothetical protein
MPADDKARPFDMLVETARSYRDAIKDPNTSPTKCEQWANAVQACIEAVQEEMETLTVDDMPYLARIATNRTMEIDVAEARLWAERHLGRLLSEMEQEGKT